MIYRGVREELNNAEETDADDPDSKLAANNKETRRDLSTREAEDSDEEMRHCARVQIHTLLDFSPLPPVSYNPFPQWGCGWCSGGPMSIGSNSHCYSCGRARDGYSDPPKRRS